MSRISPVIVALSMVCFAAVVPRGNADDKPASEKQKIEALIEHVAGLKDAVFIRNDSEYDAQAAAKFLRTKWEANEGQIKTAKDFIEKVASASTTSGKAYRILLKDGTEKGTGEYLLAELKKLENAAGKTSDAALGGWRSLPLVKDGKVDPNWVQIGWGGFGVEGGSLRTDCDEAGLGLLLYRPEKFGNCQIRVVYRAKDAKSNAGVFVRIDDGIVAKVNEKPTPARRDKDGKLTDESLKAFMAASDEERGPWYAVHRGYEVQICDASEPFNRTGAVYSLAKAKAAPAKPPAEWKTMIITLKGNLVQVDIDGQRVTDFDPDGRDVPRDRKWYEPKREPRRPAAGYIGLQNHDPGDVVYFQEVSVRPLGAAK